MATTSNRYYVGTARGLLLNTTDKPYDFKISKDEDSNEVTAISEGRNIEEILLGHKSGTAYIFNVEKSSFTKKIDRLEGDGSVCGIGCVKKAIIAGKHDGVINIWTKKNNDFFSINLDENGSLDNMVTHPNRENIVGTGGEHNDFKLWDLSTKQCIFKAKSLGHDELQLPIPTSVRGISFFNVEINLAACCTKEGHVLLYDDRAQRRPITNFFEKKASYTCISTAYRDRQVFVGTTKGYMQWLDLRAAKVLKTYTTYSGSVTDIVCDPLEPHVASVSLDRHLRVHHMETKELIYKCYMKQNLTKLFVKPVIKDEDVAEAEAVKNTDLVDQEYEELFENMEEIKEKEDDTKHNKRKSVNDSASRTVKKAKRRLQNG